LPFVEKVPVAIAFRLVGGDKVTRLPEMEARDVANLAPGVADGVMLPFYALAPFEPSATAKVVLASRQAAVRLSAMP